MNVIAHARDLAAGGRNVCVAIGVFDGVHLGHQQVIQQTVSDSRSQNAIPVAITFDRHPNAVVAPEHTPLLIYSLPQRLRALDATGIQTVLLIHFDKAFSQQPAEAFIAGLARDFGKLTSIAIGAEFTFGYKRAGNIELLKELGPKLGFQVHDLPAVSWQGATVSSTRIREVIQAGELDAATQMLGRPYALAARVVRGAELGRTLGFPTANMDVAGLVLPPTGVYAGHALFGGRRHQAVANLGLKPTLVAGEPSVHFEVHILDFTGDLYGQELEFEFGAKLRSEVKFPSLDALKEQIARDVARVRDSGILG